MIVAKAPIELRGRIIEFEWSGILPILKLNLSEIYLVVVHTSQISVDLLDNILSDKIGTSTDIELYLGSI